MKRSEIPAFIAVLFVLVCLITNTRAQTDWAQQSSSVELPLTGVAFGNGIFAAVGESGLVLTSTDGTTWTTAATGITDALRAITFGNGMFVAVGQNGTIITSTDTVTWTPQTSQTTVFLSGAAFGDGRFVVTGGSGTVRYSDDGVTWNTATSNTTTFLQGAGYGAGNFVAVGSAGLLIYSSDGQNWTTANSGTTEFLSAVAGFDGKVYVAGFGGTILSSSNGADWTAETTSTFEWLKGIGGGDGGTLIATGDGGTILTSTDGSTWTPATSGVDYTIFAVTYGSGAYIATGDILDFPAEPILLKSGEVTPLGMTFENWRSENFTAPELADPNFSGATADPDKDRISNFLEYAFGLLPKSPDPSPVSFAVVDVESEPHFSLSFTRPVDRIGFVDYTGEQSGNLAVWTDLNGTEDILSEVDGIQTVRLTSPSPLGGNNNLRLRVSGGE